MSEIGTIKTEEPKVNMLLNNLRSSLIDSIQDANLILDRVCMIENIREPKDSPIKEEVDPSNITEAICSLINRANELNDYLRIIKNGLSKLIG